MVNETIENFHLINAPAGSGKTTKIQSMITEELSNNSMSYILYITYTNRAADELNSRLHHEHLTCSTIHAFLNNFLIPYFKNPVIIDYFFDYYRVRIEDRIKNTDYKESNDRYIEKNGDLTIENMRSKIDKIEYNESLNSALYYGKIGHDDLLEFSYELFKQFKKLKLAFLAKYDFVFLDEYQDTADCVLKMFYEIIQGSNTKMYIFGDKMQQIYGNYKGSFENTFSLMNQDITLKINYRSCKQIINVLNNLYNDKKYFQNSNPNNIFVVKDKPKLYISSSPQDTIKECIDAKKDALLLYLPNSDKYEEIRAINLFKAINSMSRYSYTSKYTANEVLMESNVNDNPDLILSLLFMCSKLKDLYDLHNYGSLIQLIKENPKNLLNEKKYIISSHGDKKRINNELKLLFEKYQSDISIREFVSYLRDNNYINDKFIIGYLEDEEYVKMLDVTMDEFRNNVEYLKQPNVSTQHGVKGESHDSVIFVAKDSSILNVKMYDFFKLISLNNIDLTSFEKFLYAYQEFQDKLSIYKSGKEFTKDDVNNNKAQIISLLNEFKKAHEASCYYQCILSDKFEKCINSTVKTNLNKIGKNLVYNIIQAYRLFYVGCSRARKNLIVIIDKDKLGTQYIEPFKDKMSKIGFEVNEC